jgi:hypothetical protein
VKRRGIADNRSIALRFQQALEEYELGMQELFFRRFIDDRDDCVAIDRNLRTPFLDQYL